MALNVYGILISVLGLHISNGTGTNGLACALSLQKYGHNVTVLEKDLQLGGADTGLNGCARISPNGSKILLDWGLHTKAAVKAAAMPGFAFYKYNAGDISAPDLVGENHWDEKLLFEARGGYMQLRHRDLIRILYDETTRTDASPPVSVIFGAEVQAVDCDDCTVTLRSGEMHTGDAIIGADGARGVVRQTLMEEEGASLTDDASTGMAVYSAIIPKVAVTENNLATWFCDGLGSAVWMGHQRGAWIFPVGQEKDLILSVITPDGTEGGTWTESPDKKLIDVLGQCDVRLRRLAALAGKEAESWFWGRLHIRFHLGDSTRTPLPWKMPRLLGRYSPTPAVTIASRNFYAPSPNTGIEPRCSRIRDIDMEYFNDTTVPDGDMQARRDADMRANHAAGRNAVQGYFQDDFAMVFNYDAMDDADEWWMAWGRYKDGRSTGGLLNFSDAFLSSMMSSESVTHSDENAVGVESVSPVQIDDNMHPLQSKIAIVGIAAQLPSGDFSRDDLNYKNFWEFLVAKGQAYQPMTPELFSSSEFNGFQDKLNLPVKGAFLKNHDKLDAVALGISAKDARVMPFTARRLLELSFEALSDSGIDYRGKQVGCFMTGPNNFEVSGAVNTGGSFASVPSAIANRISYMLDITGPSIQLDTACSSSLTGLHVAIRAIEAGDCTMAMVGAAQINRELAEWKNYMLSAVLSPDGTTKPFDANADGFGRGEGAIVVVLKPLAEALRNNDHIYSVVLGSAINSTGSGLPLNVPNAMAQKECIRLAYARSGKKESDADFVELHITGTSVGDPIEANAAGEIFARSEYLDVGTVKGNVGHLEAAAFLVSLLKACLILEKRMIPPTVNFSVPSSAIDWDRHRLRVPTELEPLECRSDSGRSIVSLSGAGIGGSTGHVVLESRPLMCLPNTQNSGDVVPTFVIGGLSPKAVALICQSVCDGDLSSIEIMRACAVTLARRARQLPWRTYFTPPILAPAEIMAAVLVPRSPPPISFIFSGQGPQNLDMGRGLFSAFPAFRSTILELDDVYRGIMGESLLETTGLFISPASPPSLALSPSGWPVTITVAAIAMLQMALFDLLLSVGITPTSLVGHSAGETAILYASGAGSKSMALEIAVARGKAMTATESTDLGMASLACKASLATNIISQIHRKEGSVEISCFNSPDSVALSGSGELLEDAINLARAHGIFAQRIRTMVPGHSSFMDYIKEDYMTRMTEIFARYPGPHIPQVPVFSTCTGQVLVDEFTPSYFWANCRNPVLFSPAISNLLNFSPNINSEPMFLEISCHPVLSFTVSQHGVAAKSVLCPMRRRSSTNTEHGFGYEQTLFTETLAQITLLGYNTCDLSGLYGASIYKPSFIDHPLASRAIPPPKTHFSDVLRSQQVNGPLYTNAPMNELTHPLLAQHVINGEPILPATGFIEILLEAGANVLWDVEFKAFFSLSARNSARMILERSESRWSLKSIDSDPAVSTTKIREHAHGLMDISRPVVTERSVDLQSVWDRLPRLETEGFYRSLTSVASYGPIYQKVLRCHGSPSEVVAEIQGPSLDESSDQYHLHPATLDACIHILLHPAISKEHGNLVMYLPSKLGYFAYHNPPSVGGNWYSHIRRRFWYPGAKSYDIIVTDRSGGVICELGNLLVKKLSLQPPVIGRRLDLIFQPVAVSTKVLSPQATYSHRDHQKDEETLFKILDSLALKMISKSLQQDVVVGEALSRQRYFDFAKCILQNKTGKMLLEGENSTEMRAKYPAFFEVTTRIESIHQTIFHSSTRAVEALYSDDLMTRLYSRSSQTSTVYPEAVKSFSSLLDSLHESGKRAINVLEVGAGTGLLTNYLVDELQRRPDVLAEYTVSDTSYALASELARTIPYNKMTPKIYDLTKDAHSQGLQPESYDVIVALHVLHVVPDIQSCLRSLQSLLVPGGSLLVIEFDGTSWEERVGSVWFDCIFGSFSEWFEFADGRTHCTMSPPSWMQMLQDLGFINNTASVEAGNVGNNFLFTAQKPGSSNKPDTPDAESEIDPSCVLQYSFQQETELRSRISTMRSMDHNELYVVALEGRDGDSAMGLCATLRREFPFWDINLALFQSETQLSHAIESISNHRALYQRGEQVVLFRDDDRACLERVVLSPPPLTTREEYPIALDDEHHVLVEIIAVHAAASSVHGFVGRVVMSHSKTLSPGRIITGVVEKVERPIVVVHVGCIVSFHERLLGQDDLPDPRELLNLVAPILVSERLPKRLGPPDARLQVLVASLDENMSQALSAYFGAIETVTVVECDLRKEALSRDIDVVVSDSLTSARYPHICQWAPRPGRLLLWDTIIANNIRDATWEIAHALNSVRSQLQAPTGGVPGLNFISRGHFHAPLFLHDRSYLLLGGIGGLGVDLAVWMYQHGARHIVLTSRRGIASLDPRTDDETLSKISYLQSRDDLELRLERCDATDACATSLLVKGLHFSIAGCFQMTLALSDGLFVKQTHTEFCTAHNSKVRVFEVFAAEVDINSLDFYIAFSSFTGLIGHVGQSNYGSACTTLEGILSRYRNAFSLVVPGILDAGHLERISEEIFSPASMSVARLWACLEDGMKQLTNGSPPFARYIPDLDWASIHSQYPLPRSFHHLLPSHSRAIEIDDGKTTDVQEEEILEVMLSFVEVQKEDFDFERPLLSYGLDSLSATRLSAALLPYIQVSQIQLLAGISWSDLRAGLQSRGRPGALEPHTDHNRTDPSKRADISLCDTDNSLSTKDSPIVEICSGSGTPLILFSGGDGRLVPLLALGPIFPGTLWGVQVTEMTTTNSLLALAAFWAEKIRQKQPNGPYRLAAFSASSVVTVAVAKLLEESGQEVLQVSFIDHFPLLWAHETTARLLRERELSALAERPMKYMMELLRKDPAHIGRGERIAQMEAAWAGSPSAREPYISAAATTRRLTVPLLQFLANTFYLPDPHDESGNEFAGWVSSVKAPLSVLVAEFGMITMLPAADRGLWEGLGAHLCPLRVEVHTVAGVGHFGILANEGTAAFLQKYDRK
ncbi:hypothetical protein K438DRAFT_1976521 [Mycena galopus ATCC 62051]|nr:hypothetical protein K438DRAFT_1976521 [Mycena galopus ATCC 62051]